MTTHDRDKVIEAALKAGLGEEFWLSPQHPNFEAEVTMIERFYAIAYEAGRASRDAEVGELATGLDKTLKCIRYMQGVAERGLGRKMQDDEAPDLFLLEYVKELEEELTKLREQVKVLRDKINKYLPECDHYSDNGVQFYAELLEALAATEPKP